MIPYAHLHVHSYYSLLDGQASIARLVDKALADGMRGMALTDHGNMMGVKDFYNYVNKKKGAAAKEKKAAEALSMPIVRGEKQRKFRCSTPATP